jgi:cytochrome P450
MLTTLSLFALSLAAAWLAMYLWYFQRVRRARAQVRHADGRAVPGPVPRMLFGSLADVYRAKNRLSAYHAFHERFGTFVQIFWMWRSQVSIADYGMAREVLVAKQGNYQKHLPGHYLRRLFGSSVLTATGSQWMRDRRLLNADFSKKSIAGFHDIFVSCSEQLAAKWREQMAGSKQSVRLDVCPDVTALFLDVVGKATLSHDFGALRGEVDDFLASLNYILEQSLRPTHAIIRWWHRIPSRSNRKVEYALKNIDDYLKALIRERRQATARGMQDRYDVLDLLLQAPLTDQEVRDNLVAVIVNGHETVATSVALTLLLLAEHPEKLARARAELDRALGNANGRLSETALAQLRYLDCVVDESLRLYPPIAGLNRISATSDVLGGWSIPPRQAVGISLTPLHLDRRYFGDDPEQFRPERYLALDPGFALEGTAPDGASPARCPMQNVRAPTAGGLGRTQAGICLPLSFGGGKRKCLGEHFARYEMKVALVVLLRQFDFQVVPGFVSEVEIKRHGLAVSVFPKHGIHLDISRRMYRRDDADDMSGKTVRQERAECEPAANVAMDSE